MTHERTPRMAHMQPRDTLPTGNKWWLWPALIMLAMIGLAFLGGLARADAAATTCSYDFVNNGLLGARDWTWVPIEITVGGAAQSTACTAPASLNIPLYSRGAGDKIDMKCVERTTGTTPPATPDNVFVYALSDNSQYILNGAPSSTGLIWTSSWAGSCTSETVSFYCTSDGTVTGSPRFGLVRFVTRAVRTGIGAYDSTSDQSETQNVGTSSGVVRCDPKISAYTDGLGAGASPTKYVGGDTYRSVVTASIDYKPQNPGDLNLPCSTGTATAGGASFTTATITLDVVIKGSFVAWPDDCTVTQNFTLTRNSGLAPLTGVKYARWNQSGAPADVAFPVVNGQENLHAVRVTKPLDRTLTPSGCTQQISGNAITVAARAESVTFTCTWQNARSENVATNNLARAYVLRATQPWRDTTDFNSVDSTFGASGGLTYNAASKSTAAITTPDPVDYKRQVETYGASRTDPELYNVGNTTATLDVGAWHGFDGINMTKIPSGGTNQSAFVVSLDQEFSQARGLRGARGEPLNGIAVSCFRTRPDTSTETLVSHGSTDANGHSAIVEYAVSSPAGTWKMTCSSSLNGNSATYTVSFFHTSSVTSGTTMVYDLNWTFLPNNTVKFNVSVKLRMYDPACDCVSKAFADDVIRTTVQAYNPVTAQYDISVASRQLMQQLSPSSALYSTTVYVPVEHIGYPLNFFATANITGKPYISGTSWFNATTVDSDTSVMSMEATVYQQGMLYVIIVLGSFALLFLASKVGAAFGIVGAALSLVGIALLIANPLTGTVQAVLMLLMIATALICLFGAISIRRSGQYG